MKYKDCKVGQRVVVKGGGRWLQQYYGQVGTIVRIHSERCPYPVKVAFDYQPFPPNVSCDLGRAKGLELVADLEQGAAS